MIAIFCFAPNIAAQGQTCDQEVQEFVERYDPDGDGRAGLETGVNALQIGAGARPDPGSSPPGGDCESEILEVIEIYEPCADGAVDLKTVEYALQVLVADDGIDTVSNSLGMTFSLIPACTYTMGSPNDEPGHDSNEEQTVETIEEAFYMQTEEVTQGKWTVLMGSNPSYYSACGDDCPVENVSYNDIRNFIAALDTLGKGT